LAKKKLAEKKIGRKKKPAEILACCTCLTALYAKKYENIGKNIFLVLYIMFKAPISTIPQ
jgi:hypothetical protein